MNKHVVILVLKIIIGVCTAVLSVLGASTLVSCQVSKSIQSKGHTRIYTVDTTNVYHSGNLKFKFDKRR